MNVSTEIFAENDHWLGNKMKKLTKRWKSDKRKSYHRKQATGNDRDKVYRIALPTLSYLSLYRLTTIEKRAESCFPSHWQTDSNARYDNGPVNVFQVRICQGAGDASNHHGMFPDCLFGSVRVTRMRLSRELSCTISGHFYVRRATDAAKY
jgi:hypothetical protein